MFDEGELRRDLAALLRDNREEVAERLERGYVEAYPRSRANFMAASAIHQWTLDEIENLAQVVESRLLHAHLSRPVRGCRGRSPQSRAYGLRQLYCG